MIRIGKKNILKYVTVLLVFVEISVGIFLNLDKIVENIGGMIAACELTYVYVGIILMCYSCGLNHYLEKGMEEVLPLIPGGSLYIIVMLAFAVFIGLHREIIRYSVRRILWGEDAADADNGCDEGEDEHIEYDMDSPTDMAEVRARLGDRNLELQTRVYTLKNGYKSVCYFLERNREEGPTSSARALGVIFLVYPPVFLVWAGISIGVSILGIIMMGILKNLDHIVVNIGAIIEEAPLESIYLAIILLGSGCVLTLNSYFEKRQQEAGIYIKERVRAFYAERARLEAIGKEKNGSSSSSASASSSSSASDPYIKGLVRAFFEARARERLEAIVKEHNGSSSSSASASSSSSASPSKPKWKEVFVVLLIFLLGMACGMVFLAWILPEEVFHIFLGEVGALEVPKEVGAIEVPKEDIREKLFQDILVLTGIMAARMEYFQDTDHKVEQGR